ncbi:MAG: hypothetical protein KJN84_07685, partial [Bacteroidia bacterium]|nr:hypothetical protein [Bacteroidia bacterium]
MKHLLVLFSTLILVSCSSYRLKEHNFPDPVDTYEKPVTFQEKREITNQGITADNLFDGARMNDFLMVNDTTFRVVVSPENFPINGSAYFGFRIKSTTKRNIDLEIEYTQHEHRYIPKLSYDGENWTAMDTMLFDTIKAPNLATLKLEIDSKPLFVCGQELMTSDNAVSWTKNIVEGNKEASSGVAGKSKLGRDIIFFDIDFSPRKGKETVVIFSRLHPPEVTGYIAMQS